jgi:hypothetical protein
MPDDGIHRHLVALLAGNGFKVVPKEVSPGKVNF